MKVWGEKDGRPALVEYDTTGGLIRAQLNDAANLLRLDVDTVASGAMLPGDVARYVCALSALVLEQARRIRALEEAVFTEEPLDS